MTSVSAPERSRNFLSLMGGGHRTASSSFQSKSFYFFALTSLVIKSFEKCVKETLGHVSQTSSPGESRDFFSPFA